jgi:hypothetical protein
MSAQSNNKTHETDAFPAIHFHDLFGRYGIGGVLLLALEFHTTEQKLYLTAWDES